MKIIELFKTRKTYIATFQNYKKNPKFQKNQIFKKKHVKVLKNTVIGKKC